MRGRLPVTSAPHAVTGRATFRRPAACYQYLPSTAANLAELTAPIPPGFRRTAQPVTPKNAPPFYLETEAPAEPGHSGR